MKLCLLVIHILVRQTYGFFQIIHVHADHRPFTLTLGNVHMETIGILHPNISGIFKADAPFCVLPFKSQLFKQGDG